MPDVSPSDLRVALFTGNFNYAVDGVSLTLNRQVAYLIGRGVAVRVFSPTVADPPIPAAGPVVSVPSLPFPFNPIYRFALGLPRRARRELAAFRPNLVHLATPDWLGFAALAWARRRGVPAVATFHTHLSSYLKFYGFGLLEPAAWWLQRRFYNRCAETYVPSASMRDVLAAHGVRGPLVVWPHGVDTDRFGPGRRSNGWRKKLGVGEDDVLIAFVGRLVWEKGLEVFARVVEGLRSAGVPHRSAVIGDGPARAALAARLPETRFTGFLDNSDLATAFASADIFLYPSASETFGLVTVEAMASGLPVVAADAPGSRDLVADGVQGFLRRPGDADDFRQAVERLIAGPDLRRRMGVAALARAAEFRWPAVLEQLVGHYCRVVGWLGG
jgi:glycosyltransferase involved in cell wall biosynthesis